jgi:hypothetical protein
MPSNSNGRTGSTGTSSMRALRDRSRLLRRLHPRSPMGRYQAGEASSEMLNATTAANATMQRPITKTVTAPGS